MFKVYESDKQTKAFSPKQGDVLWLCRFLVGEGAKNEIEMSALLWCMVNRYLLHPSSYKHWPTFEYMLRAFSQPINPRWYEGGRLAKKFAGTEHTTPARLVRREWLSTLPLSEISSKTVSVVGDFVTGRLPPPQVLSVLDKPRVSNFATRKGLPERFPWGISFHEKQYKNWMFEDHALIKGKVLYDYW